MLRLLIDLSVTLILILGVWQFRTPRGARSGNLTAAFALLCATALVLGRHHVMSAPVVLAAAGTGIALGGVLARRIHMIQIPAMVAFQHGMGGMAAFLISFVELTRATGRPLPPMAEVSALLGLVIGAATSSGSMIAGGKLADRLPQRPVILPGHSAILAGLSGTVLLLLIPAGLAVEAGAVKVLALVLIGLSVMLGVVLSIRIGGADMPVLISFLNATAGLAAALCGIAIRNQLLIVCGATVAASGSILTHVMCRAMNRSLASVLTGEHVQHRPAGVKAPEALAAAEATAAPAPQTDAADPFARALAVAKSAQKIIIIPGYGMALADAQEEVSRLAEKLTAMGKDVLFAIHPVAGRMPGHMHVLLAEAEVDYRMVRDLSDVNSEFAQTDLALIVGACDVVNPAAMDTAGTPISGMPILWAHEARDVVVCNLDDRPGYSGVENSLYRNPRTILLFGDAKTTLARFVRELDYMTVHDSATLPEAKGRAG